MKIGFTIESQSAEIHVSVISFDSFDAFDEMWEGTDKHQGGVTIKNPEACRGGWQYFVPSKQAFRSWRQLILHKVSIMQVPKRIQRSSISLSVTCALAITAFALLW